MGDEIYETKYLLDETPVWDLNIDWIDTPFFKNHCLVPEEILYELRYNKPVYEKMNKYYIPVCARILEKLQQDVMPRSGNIVNLYRNEGNGDVLLIATALVKKEEEEDGQGKLFKTDWKIVTCDKGVEKMAVIFGISCISKEEFYKILEEDFEKVNNSCSRQNRENSV